MKYDVKIDNRLYGIYLDVVFMKMVVDKFCYKLY